MTENPYASPRIPRRKLLATTAVTTSALLGLAGGFLTAFAHTTTLAHSPARFQSAHSLLTFPNHQQTVRAVAWSPQGQLLASAGDDQHLLLWNPAGSVQQTLPHPASITALAWSPMGDRIASGAANQLRFFPTSMEHNWLSWKSIRQSSTAWPGRAPTLFLEALTAWLLSGIRTPITSSSALPGMTRPLKQWSGPAMDKQSPLRQMAEPSASGTRRAARRSIPIFLMPTFLCAGWLSRRQEHCLQQAVTTALFGSGKQRSANIRHRALTALCARIRLFACTVDMERSSTWPGLLTVVTWQAAMQMAWSRSGR